MNFQTLSIKVCYNRYEECIIFKHFVVIQHEKLNFSTKLGKICSKKNILVLQLPNINPLLKVNQIMENV